MCLVFDNKDNKHQILRQLRYNKAMYHRLNIGWNIQYDISK